MSWRRENSCPYWDLNSDPSAVQPIASHYTDYAIPALPPPPYFYIKELKLKREGNTPNIIFKGRIILIS
jgi:hypothetical protein